MRPALCAFLSATLPFASGDLSFVAIGDWGGDTDEEPTTKNQKLTSAGLTRIAEKVDSNFTLLMGDNFYHHGVLGDEYSRRFQSTFEDVYATPVGPDGSQCKAGYQFFAMAGNHDYGEGQLANVSAQLAYTQHSSRWTFPALWYKIQREFIADGQRRVLEVLVIDTVVLCGNGQRNEALVDQQLEFRGRPADQERPGQLRKQIAEEQWSWLVRELDASSADFLWVSGHYPIWSAGNDGSSQCLIDRLQPLLISHGAHYISGHDHMLEHFTKNGLNTFVVGAGKECCYSPVHMWQIPHGIMKYMLAGRSGRESNPPTPFDVHGGFASLRFGAEDAVVTLHAHNGEELYVAPAIPRRNFLLRSSLATMDVPLLSSLPTTPLVCSLVLASFLFSSLFIAKRRYRAANDFDYEPLLAA